ERHFSVVAAAGNPLEAMCPHSVRERAQLCRLDGGRLAIGLNGGRELIRSYAHQVGPGEGTHQLYRRLGGIPKTDAFQIQQPERIGTPLKKQIEHAPSITWRSPGSTGPFGPFILR